MSETSILLYQISKLIEGIEKVSTDTKSSGYGPINQQFAHITFKEYAEKYEHSSPKTIAKLSEIAKTIGEIYSEWINGEGHYLQQANIIFPNFVRVIATLTEPICQFCSAPFLPQQGFNLANKISTDIGLRYCSPITCSKIEKRQQTMMAFLEEKLQSLSLSQQKKRNFDLKIL